MDPAQNTLGGNDAFTSKAPLYKQSSVLLTQEIGAKTIWAQTEIGEQKQLLIDAALKIFIP